MAKRYDIPRRLIQSPLPARIAPEVPLRDWLWHAEGLFNAVLIPADKSDVLVPRFLAVAKEILKIDDELCVIFVSPQKLDPATLGPVLPLRRIGQGRYASFETSALPSPPAAQHVHLVREGQHQAIDLSRAERLDPLSFWQFDSLEILQAGEMPTLIPWGKSGETPQSATPQLSAKIAEVVKDGPLFDDLYAQIDAVKPPPFDLRLALRDLTGSWIFWLVILLIPVIFIGPSVSVVPTILGFTMLILLIIALVFLISFIVGFGMRVIGVTAPSQSAAPLPSPPPPPSAPGAPKGQGLFDRIKGWALWKTPLGNGLRSKMQKRIDEVERLINAGEIDAALKKAMALGKTQDGAKDTQQKHLPTGMPQDRTSLDLDFSGFTKPSQSILSEHGYEEMHQQYYKLAQKLSADGDHQRAAFIYSELLDNIHAALNELEQADAYEDAAKLATARKFPVNTVASLWFLAGQEDVALALARRHDALEFIANFAQETNPEFAQLARQHWVQDLAASGDLAGAVIESEVLPDMQAQRDAWIDQAILEGELVNPEFLRIAAFSRSWSADALDHLLPGGGADPLAVLSAFMSGVIHNTDDSSASLRAFLLQGLDDATKSKQAPVGPFWEDRAPLFADRLMRSALSEGSTSATKPNLKNFRRLAKNLNLQTLAEDIRHIVRRAPETAAHYVQLVLPNTAKSKTTWAHICILPQNRFLVGSDAGEVSVIEADGKRQWTDQLSDLVGLVPIGVGRFVIIIQGQDELRTLSLLDTRSRTYRRLGRLSLVTWHQYASAAQWLVQTPQDVMAIDITGLLATPTQFEKLWSIKQTVPLIVLGFDDNIHSISWHSQRIVKGKPGLIENWWMQKSNMLMSVSVIPPDSPENLKYYTDPMIMGDNNGFYAINQPVNPRKMLEFSRSSALPFSLEYERELLKICAKELDSLEGFANITDTGTNKSIFIQDIPAVSGPAKVNIWREKKIKVVGLSGAQVFAQASSADGKTHALIDDHGRLIVSRFPDLAVSVLLI